jgi:thioredoxin-like negative regulator of GroEL
VGKDVFIFEVSEKSVDQSVMLNSHKIPVVVEFMGGWSEPCVLLADVFSSHTGEYPEPLICY